MSDFAQCPICKEYAFMKQHKCKKLWLVEYLDDMPSGSMENPDYMHIHAKTDEEAAKKTNASDSEWYEVEEQLFAVIDPDLTDDDGNWPHGSYKVFNVTWETSPDFYAQEQEVPA